MPWRLPDHGHRADFELRIGNNILLGEALLSRSSVHFNEKIDRLKALAQQKRAIPLLAAPSLSPERQEHLRSLGICYVDLAGNAWIKAPGILIDQRSREEKIAGKSGISPGKLDERHGLDPFGQGVALVAGSVLFI